MRVCRPKSGTVFWNNMVGNAAGCIWAVSGKAVKIGFFQFCGKTVCSIADVNVLAFQVSFLKSSGLMNFVMKYTFAITLPIFMKLMMVFINIFVHNAVEIK